MKKDGTELRKLLYLVHLSESVFWVSDNDLIFKFCHFLNFINN